MKKSILYKMTEETNKKIIVNHYYIEFENLKDFINLNNQLFFPINFTQKEDPNKNILLMKKRNIPEYNEKISKNNQQINEISFNIIDNKNENKINNNNLLELKETNDITIELGKDKKDFFKIVKKGKNKGRIPKSLNLIGYHTKFSHDNILRKLKVKFFKKIVKYINRIIISKYGAKIKKLLPLNGKISQNNTIIFNRKLLYSKLKDIFLLSEINGKYKLVQKDYNKEIIIKIYNENIKELIDILEMTLLDVYKIFRDSNETNKLNGLEKLDIVINEVKNKENNEEYIKKFTKVANNFEYFYLNKEPKKLLNF